MTRTVKAKICWIPAEAGGRKAPPAGPRYSTVVRFKGNKGNWSEQAWSIVAEFSEPPDEALCVVADIRFLVEDAPSHLLYPGSSFKLFEGARLVATGEVLLETEI